MFVLNLLVLLTVVGLAVRNRDTKPSLVFLANLATADAAVFVCLLVLSLLTSNWAASQSSTLIRAELEESFYWRCRLEVGVLGFCLYSSLAALTLLAADRSQSSLQTQH